MKCQACAAAWHFANCAIRKLSVVGDIMTVMPSIPHEAPAELLRNNPLLALALLSAAKIPVPAGATVRMGDTNLSTRKPLPKELRGDAVALLKARRWKFAAVIEPQTDPPKIGKRRSLTAYGPVAGSVHECDAAVIIIAFDMATARACRKTIATGHPGYNLTPLVVGPDNTPDPFDPVFAYACPELVVLGCLTKGLDLADRQTQVKVLRSLASLERERHDDYTFLIRIAASDAARRQLEDMMALVYKDDFIDRWRDEGLALGRAEGVALGRAEGRAKGLVEGRVEGRVEGEAQMLLRVIAARGLSISEELRARVLASTDVSQLEAWGDRAMSAQAVSDIFD